MPWLPKKLVVVPMAFNGDSLEPINVALEMVKAPQDIHIIHVLPKLSSMEPGAVWGDVTNETRTEKAAKEIRKQLAGDERHGGCNLIVRVGAIAREVSRYAEEMDAELVVLASKTHSRAHSFFLGSAVDSILHEAHCPVLIIKH